MATKTMESAWRRYCKSEVYYLCGENEHCAYGRCSEKKWKAWDYCKGLMEKLEGESMRFIGVGIQIFSCGFTFKNEDGERMFMYITPSYNRHCKISELEDKK